MMENPSGATNHLAGDSSVSLTTKAISNDISKSARGSSPPARRRASSRRARGSPLGSSISSSFKQKPTGSNTKTEQTGTGTVMNNLSGATNHITGDSSVSLTTKAISNDVGKSASGSSTPARRRAPSRRARGGPGSSLSSSFSKSLGNRNQGLAGTKGRLSVSFSDQKGLSASEIGDILSGFEDGEDEPEASMSDLLETKKGGSISSLNKRMNLMTIQSQRAVTFNIDPKDLEDSDDE